MSDTIDPAEFPRLLDLAERLTKPGGKAAHVSCSESHEIAGGVFGLLDAYASLTRTVEEQRATIERLEGEVHGLVDGSTRTFRSRAADELADEVAVLVRRKVIDMRSPAADALLSFRDPPSTERADRMAELESALATARRELAEARNDRDILNGLCSAYIAERDEARQVIAAVRAARVEYDEDDSTPATLIEQLDEALDGTPAEARRGLTEREAFVLRWAKRITAVVAGQDRGNARAASLAVDFGELADRILSAPSHQTSGTGEGLTVGEALRLPEVRSGAKWIESVGDHNSIRVRLRVQPSDDGPMLAVSWWHVHAWLDWNLYRAALEDLYLPCTLVDAGQP